MGELMRILEPHSLIGLDTCVFIYHLESHPRYSRLTIPLFHQIEAGRFQAVTSVISLMEVNVRPLAPGRRAVADEYEILLSRFPNLAIRDVDQQIARQAAELRARHRLRPPDALQIATALQAGATAFLTNDARLSTAGVELTIIVLDRILGN